MSLLLAFLLPDFYRNLTSATQRGRQAYDENRAVFASLVTELLSASDRMLRPLFRSFLGPRPPNNRQRNNFSKWRPRGKKTTQRYVAKFIWQIDKAVAIKN